MDASIIETEFEVGHTPSIKPSIIPRTTFKTHYSKIKFETEKQNLTEYDPRLADFLEPSDHFFIQDITNDLHRTVSDAGISDGMLVVQILHTSATLIVNEIDEPMLLGDIMRKCRNFASKQETYLHNSHMRVVNRCSDDNHCDRNGDAHVKAALFGHSSVSFIIKDGKMVVGKWQKIALLEFDGPRPREILIQAIGI